MSASEIRLDGGQALAARLRVRRAGTGTRYAEVLGLRALGEPAHMQPRVERRANDGSQRKHCQDQFKNWPYVVPDAFRREDKTPAHAFSAAARRKRFWSLVLAWLDPVDAVKVSLLTSMRPRGAGCEHSGSGPLGTGPDSRTCSASWVTARGPLYTRGAPSGSIGSDGGVVEWQTQQTQNLPGAQPVRVQVPPPPPTSNRPARFYLK